MSLEETLRMLSQATQSQGHRVQQAQAQPVNRRLINPGQRARDVITNPTDNQSRALLEMSMQMLQQKPGELPAASMSRGISRGMDVLDTMRNRDREQNVESAQTGYDVAHNSENMAVRGAQAENQRMFAEGGRGSRQSNAPSGYRYVEDESGDLSLEPIPGGPADRSDVETGTVPQGYMVQRDENGIPTMVPIQGGPAYQKQRDEARKAAVRKTSTQMAGGTVVQDLQRAQDDYLPNLFQDQLPMAGAMRAASAKIPGTAEHQFGKFIESALSNVGLDALQRIRDGSPTGGALGQVPVQQQMRLEKVLGSLDISQNIDVLKENMDRIHNIYIDIMYGGPEEHLEALKDGTMTPDEIKEIQAMKKELPFDELGRPSKKVGRFTIEEE